MDSNVIHHVNSHIHTPYSFSAFQSITEAAIQANAENVRLLGINDFYSVEGYDEFFEVTSKYHVFPLFNIEFTGLDKEYQDHAVRINDPNNPGRIYLCGKGLNYPVVNKTFIDSLNTLQESNNQQAKSIIEKANAFFHNNQIDIALDYNSILVQYTKNIVRERHIARAIKDAVFALSPAKEQKIALLTKIFRGTQLTSDIENSAALENEIRNNFLKDGKPAFVQEIDKAFYSLKELVNLIKLAGGIPCYPSLLGDTLRACTEFENDWEKMHAVLSSLNIHCVELIPSRNTLDMLTDFVKFFHQRKYIILFGTEHNTPEKSSLLISCKNKTEIPVEIRKIAYDGACVIAAHQFLMNKMNIGYVDDHGNNNYEQINEFATFGRSVIHSYLKR
ncbi:MAG: hypothetical protein EHM64_06195 [Ignavibacteriae bacterium]|nr:MAG: hypothetical protein EHM64_06195 [Ignavibacteriota bacterium]